MDKETQQLIRNIQIGNITLLPLLNQHYTRIGGKRCPCPMCPCTAMIDASSIFCDDCEEEHWPHEDWTHRTLDMCKCRWCDIPIYRPDPWNHNHYYLELHANSTFNDARIWGLPDDHDFDYDFYGHLIEIAVDSFQEGSGVEVQLLGRSGRHVCVEDTLENRDQYEELRDLALHLEQRVIDGYLDHPDHGPESSDSEHTTFPSV